MTEAIPPVVAFGFEQMELQQIEAEVDTANLASIRLLERSGFVEKLEGETTKTKIYVLSGCPSPL